MLRNGIRKEYQKTSMELSDGRGTNNKTKEEKDLGVIVQKNLNPQKHIRKIFGLAYKMLTNIRVAFQFMGKDMMKKLLQAYVQSQNMQQWCGP
ncbi:hypothetical protein E2C01_019865 [Portunus trituberculatus]|uniref:Uncharacterized protein n=1 Tax=Portunus trituberculatus TaxID=210409 RepID=A0A5B7E005_PORTR|nr:hypothetical protein [Portunus trituberculatus]